MITRYQRTVLIKELLIPTIMAVIAVVLIMYAVIPNIQRMQDIIVSIQATQNENDGIRKKIAALSALDEDTLRSHMQILLSAVPSDKSVATILSAIDNVSSEQSISVTDLAVSGLGSISTDSAGTAQKIDSKLGSNTLPVSISVSGTFDQIIAFVGKIHSVRRLLRISGLNLSLFGGEASPTAKVKMSLEAFYAPLPKTLGKAADDLKPLSAGEEELLTKLSSFPLEGISTQLTSGTVVSGTKIDPFSP